MTKLHEHYCERCNHVGDWHMVRTYRSRWGTVEVYRCPVCGMKREYVVGA